MEKQYQIKDYNAILSDPVLVYQSPADMKQAWGYYQFPCLCRTVTGEILASWCYSDDSVLKDGENVAAIKHAVSRDCGKTWSAVPDAELSRYRSVCEGAPTKDGKCFVSFDGENGARIPAKQITATPYAEGALSFWYGKRRNRIYLASDIAKLKLTDVNGTEVTKFRAPNTVRMNECDPVTGENSSREVTVNWRHMSVGAGEDGEFLILTPMSYLFRINSSHGVVAKDGTLYYALYAAGFDSSKEDIAEASASETCIYNSVYVLSSTDGGDTWNYLSQVSASDIPNFAPGLNVEGADEPYLNLMPDGTFAMLFRTGDNNMPMYIVRSSDGCRTWSTPVKFDSLGVLPQMLTLDCGVTVASYGRPRIFVRTTSDPTGKDWQEHIEIPLSPQSPESNEKRLSCCYTHLLPTGAASALLIYTDFHHPTGDGTFTKAIMVREIRIEPKESMG